MSTFDQTDSRYYIKGLTYTRDEISSLLNASPSGDLGPIPSTSYNPGVVTAGKSYSLVPGTYTYLLGSGGTPIVIPTPAAGHSIFNARAYFNGTYWVPTWVDITLPTVDLSPYQLISSALKTDTNGNLYAAIVPDVQYKHSRGDTEIAGNTTYTSAATYGIGMFEQMTQNIVVNQITMPIWGAADSAVTVRLYKASAIGPNPSAMTLMEELNIAAGAFNTTTLGNAVINFVGQYKFATSDYVYIFLNVTAGTKLSVRYWNALFGSSPERHNFYYYNSATGTWTTNWSASAAGLYQTSFILSQKSASQIALENSVKAVSANAVIADTNKNITGVKLPTVQWNHSRGDAETLGNTQYGPASTNYGIGYYDQVTNNAVINSVSAPIWAAADAAVTVRIYKSIGFTNVFASQTLLEEKVYAAGAFNSTTGAMFEILLSGTYAINANEYVYLYANWVSGTTTPKLASMYWNALYGSAPERHTFMYLAGATAWATNYTVAASPFYQPSLKFRYRNDVETDLSARMAVVETNKVFNPRLAIPAKVFVAVGRECNIWNDALCVNPFNQEVRVNYAGYAGWALSTPTLAAKNKERGLRYTPTTTETNTITVTVRNRNYTLLATKTFVLQAVAKNNGSGTKQIVLIGDSTTLGAGGGASGVTYGLYPTELLNLITTDGGFTGKLLGVKGTAPNLYEGRGGWLWSNYLNAGPSSDNAFWDATNSRLDFQRWMSNNGNFGGTNTVDMAAIQLGINDVIFSITSGIGVSYLDTSIANAKTFITALLNPTYGYPGCKIILSLPPIASISRDAFALDYPNVDKDLYEANMRTYYEKMILNFDNAAYNANVSVCATGLWIDRIYAYNRTAVNVSARHTTDTILENTSPWSVHLKDDGQYQQADAIYSHIRAVIGGLI